jgi:hypothetical protein
MEAPTVVLLMAMSVLILLPSARRAAARGVRRLLKNLFVPLAKRGVIFSTWWVLIALVLVLQAVPLVLSLFVAIAHVWLWLLLIPLAVFSLKLVWRLNGPWSRQPRRKRLPGRRRR